MDVFTKIVTISVPVLVVLIAFYTCYKKYWEKPKCSMSHGDRLSLVISRGGGCRKFQLHVNVVNKSMKAGTLHHLEAEVVSPENTVYSYQWRIFFEHQPGTLNRQPRADVHPVSLTGNSSNLLPVEFKAIGQQAAPAWSPGLYSVTLIGWVKKGNKKKKTSIKSKFDFKVTEEQSKKLQKCEPEKPVLVPIDIL